MNEIRKSPEASRGGSRTALRVRQIPAERSLFARFSAPVFPGETIRFEIYREGAETAFRARIRERDRVVLDYGRAEIAS